MTHHTPNQALDLWLVPMCFGVVVLVRMVMLMLQVKKGKHEDEDTRRTKRERARCECEAGHSAGSVVSWLSTIGNGPHPLAPRQVPAAQVCDDRTKVS